ncbi:MAG TPA: hypothetical protein VM581_01390 [Magnetospirillaceae bacterium]|nr:hypothetical protein [Magnetospirillaceae bacterium]
MTGQFTPTGNDNSGTINGEAPAAGEFAGSNESTLVLQLPKQPVHNDAFREAVEAALETGNTAN